MKISQHTLGILRNFAQINPGIIVKAGNKIKVREKSTNLFYGSVTVEETFPVDFAIGDLMRFLSLASLFDSPDYEFRADRVIITDDNGRKLQFRYANEAVITSIPYDKDMVLPDTPVAFEWTKENHESLQKGTAALKAPQIAIIGENGALRVTTWNTKDQSSDQFSVDVGPTDHAFRAVFDAGYIRLIPQLYHVTVSLDRFIAKFEGNPSYWLPGHVDSKRM